VKIVIDKQTRETRVQAYKPLYRFMCLPDKQMQANRLEALRYKWGNYKNGVRVMQRLGDFGREYFPWIAGVKWR
jgi:hypothetical protein